VTGQVLYDGFGGVLSSTLPFPPTSETGGTADVATGLVHMGDGRWLDPALGRPLQPNPNGGPPTVPQAPNRFAATSLGQPGVYQAARTDGFNGTPPVASFVYGTTTQLAGKLHHVVAYLPPYRRSPYRNACMSRAEKVYRIAMSVGLGMLGGAIGRPFLRL
jgi:hypothetical protein